jgi:hypothetical protein
MSVNPEHNIDPAPASAGDDNLIPPRRPLPAERYVYVRGLGDAEINYRAPPADRPTLLVRLVDDKFEETVTFNACVGEPGADTVYTVRMPPPGRGWTFDRAVPPGSSAWRRRRRRRRRRS